MAGTMKNFRPYDRSQRLLLPPDLKDWVAIDELCRAHGKLGTLLADAGHGSSKAIVEGSP